MCSGQPAFYPMVGYKSHAFGCFKGWLRREQKKNRGTARRKGRTRELSCFSFLLDFRAERRRREFLIWFSFWVGHSALRGKRGGRFYFVSFGAWFGKKKRDPKGIKKGEGVGKLSTKRGESRDLSKKPESFFCFSSGVVFSCTYSLISVAKEVQKKYCNHDLAFNQMEMLS